MNKNMFYMVITGVLLLLTFPAICFICIPIRNALECAVNCFQNSFLLSYFFVFLAFLEFLGLAFALGAWSFFFIFLLEEF